MVIRINRGWNFAPILLLNWGQDPNGILSEPGGSSLSFVTVRMLQIFFGRGGGGKRCHRKITEYPGGLQLVCGQDKGET